MCIGKSDYRLSGWRGGARICFIIVVLVVMGPFHLLAWLMMMLDIYIYIFMGRFAFVFFNIYFNLICAYFQAGSVKKLQEFLHFKLLHLAYFTTLKPPQPQLKYIRLHEREDLTTYVS